MAFLSIPTDMAYLLYIPMALAHFTGYQDAVSVGIKMGTSSPLGNYVCNAALPNAQDIKNVKQFYKPTPLQWWVSNPQKDALAPILETEDFIYQYSVPFMHIELDTLKKRSHNRSIKIRCLDQTYDTNDWTKIFSAGFCEPLAEARTFVTYILHNAVTTLIYLGYWNGVPACIGMAIAHGSSLSLHCITTLPAFRGKGLASALTHQMLLDGKNRSMKTALLGTSTQGRSVYEKLGFSAYDTAHVYLCQTT